MSCYEVPSCFIISQPVFVDLSVLVEIPYPMILISFWYNSDYASFSRIRWSPYRFVKKVVEIHLIKILIYLPQVDGR